MRYREIFQFAIFSFILIFCGMSLSAQETWLVPRQVKVPGEWGYADSLTGKMIISPRYVSAWRFYGNLAVVCKGVGKYAFIDKQGNELPAFNKSRRITRIVIPAQAGGPGLVRYLVYQKDNVGLVDPDLNLLIPIEYKNILVQGNLLMLVQPDPNEKYAEIMGAARPDGKIITPVKYKKIEASGYLVHCKRDTWSALGELYNLDGQKLLDELVSVDLKEIPFRNQHGKTYLGLSYYPGNEKVSVAGIIDSAGNVLLPFEYLNIRFPDKERSGFITVIKKDNYSQLLNPETFRVVMEAKSIRELNSRIIKLQNDSLTGFVDYEGKVLYPMEKMECTYKDGFIKVKKNGKYGYLDSLAVKLTECIYDEAGDFMDGEARVHAYNKFSGYIDRQGKPVGKNQVLDRDYKENFLLERWLRVDYKDKYCEAKFPGSVTDIDVLGTVIVSSYDSLYPCSIYYKRITSDDNGEKWVYDYIKSEYAQVEDISVQRDPKTNKFISGSYLILNSKDIYTRMYLTQSKERFFVLMMKSDKKKVIPSPKYFDRFKLNFKYNKYVLD
jgi:hypothetical protein